MRVVELGLWRGDAQTKLKHHHHPWWCGDGTHPLTCWGVLASTYLPWWGGKAARRNAMVARRKTDIIYSRTVLLHLVWMYVGYCTTSGTRIIIRHVNLVLMLPLFRTPFSDVFTVCTSCKYRIYGVVYQSNFVGLPTTLYTRPHFQISRILTLSKISSTMIQQRR